MNILKNRDETGEISFNNVMGVDGPPVRTLQLQDLSWSDQSRAERWVIHDLLW